jgi:lysozyme family protein
MAEQSERFRKFIPFIFEWEGGYDNDPDDPGGETKYGIDKRSHPKENIRALTRERAQEIYWNEYWLKGGCEEVPYPLGEVQFNCNVNAGFGRTDKILASIHPDTAANFIDEQERFYRRLVEARPKSRKYLKGWLNRTHALRSKVGLI